jgi:hypothetical protein
MIIVLTTRTGERLYLGANGITKQQGRALNVFSKTADKRIETLKQSEWYLLNGKGCKISTEASPVGALGRPRKVAKRGPGRPAAKRGPGRPKGSKNKRGPGRPKGSKNKPKVVEAEAAAAPVEATAAAATA